MSNLTVAAFSPEPAEPLPERSEGDDVVEAYSFNTGDLSDCFVARPICLLSLLYQ